MKILIISACLLAVANSVSLAGTRGAGDADVTSLVHDVRELLEQARKGIQSDDLEEEALNIASAARDILNKSQVKENGEAVKKLLNDVAKTFQGDKSSSALFDGPLGFDEDNLYTAFQFLNGLADKAQQLSDAAEPVQDVVAAIEKTAKSVADIVEDIENKVVDYRASQHGQGSRSLKARGVSVSISVQCCRKK